MAASMVVLRLHAGLKRPAIATLFPTARLPLVVLDSGANVDCAADELVQFARLGVVYAEDLLRRDNPAVGLLSIGEEPEKGNAVVKEAHQLLETAGLHFVGNVEGRDLPAGACDRGPIDVVVCDGFVGNVALKVSEGLVDMVKQMLHESLEATITRKMGYLLSRTAYTDFKKRVDYSEYGGAPLLGVGGVFIICHGRSNPKAIQNAIRVAHEFHQENINERIEQELLLLNPEKLVSKVH
jgi:glycerol-3-phosphate acyltransferase PlsX